GQRFGFPHAMRKGARAFAQGRILAELFLEPRDARAQLGLTAARRFQVTQARIALGELAPQHVPLRERRPELALLLRQSLLTLTEQGLQLLDAKPLVAGC